MTADYEEVESHHANWRSVCARLDLYPPLGYKIIIPFVHKQFAWQLKVKKINKTPQTMLQDKKSLSLDVNQILLILRLEIDLCTVFARDPLSTVLSSKETTNNRAKTFQHYKNLELHSTFIHNIETWRFCGLCMCV